LQQPKQAQGKGIALVVPAEVVCSETVSPAPAPQENGSRIPCPVCGVARWRPWGTVRGEALSQCEQCHLAATADFVEGRKNPDTLYDVEPAHAEIYARHYLPHRRALYARCLPQLDRFRETGRLLEVGSGYGYFLEMAAQAGWQAEGVEISRYCCEIARLRGCRVHHGHLHEAALGASTYDCVVLWDVIEHFTHPDAILRQCHALLRPGGAVLMRTPDARALARSFDPARAAYRSLAYPANTAEHVFHFTPRDLAALAANSGFMTDAIDHAGPWRERVISGNNRAVWAGRWLLMRLAEWRDWPYEFVFYGVKPA
jgi:2-polyprenyl-3-methyl-5-hydroxy-6-metoxy-1,4-benzoquinol methylase